MTENQRQFDRVITTAAQERERNRETVREGGEGEGFGAEAVYYYTSGQVPTKVTKSASGKSHHICVLPVSDPAAHSRARITEQPSGECEPSA